MSELVSTLGFQGEITECGAFGWASLVDRVQTWVYSFETTMCDQYCTKKREKKRTYCNSYKGKDIDHGRKEIENIEAKVHA